MSFRFNIDLSFDFPRAPPRNGNQSISPDEDEDNPRIKKGWPGWLQTARQHPHYSLRLLYFLACIIGLILETVVLNNVWGSFDIQDLHNAAAWLLVVGFFWQLITFYDHRLFSGRRVPNWAIAIVESLGFLGFLALIIGNAITLNRPGYSLASGDNILVIYSSSAWVICCLVNAILALQCYAQGWRNVRPKRAVCPDCERDQCKGKGKEVAGDEYEALLGDVEGEAGPSEQVAQAPYRDQEEGAEIA